MNPAQARAFAEQRRRGYNLLQKMLGALIALEEDFLKEAPVHKPEKFTADKMAVKIT